VNVNDTPEDLFDLMSRWDIEAKEIPAFILRQGPVLSQTQRKDLLMRRAMLKRLITELRDAMREMDVHYRGLVNGVVVITADTEEECWAAVGDDGTVQFNLSTGWAPTDSAIEHDMNRK
jgi:hypothetical protein